MDHHIDSAATKSEDSPCTKREAPDDPIDSRPVYVPRGSFGMPSVSSLPRRNTTTASAAGSEHFGDSEEGTYSRHSMPMIRAHVERFKSHSVKGQETLTSVSVLCDDYASASGVEEGTASERIKTCGSGTAEKDNAKVKAPRCPPQPTAALAMKYVSTTSVLQPIASYKLIELNAE